MFPPCTVYFRSWIGVQTQRERETATDTAYSGSLGLRSSCKPIFSNARVKDDAAVRAWLNRKEDQLSSALSVQINVIHYVVEPVFRHVRRDNCGNTIFIFQSRADTVICLGGFSRRRWRWGAEGAPSAAEDPTRCVSV